MNNPLDNGLGILSHELAKQLLEHPNVPVYYTQNAPTMVKVDKVDYTNLPPLGELKLEPNFIHLIGVK